MNPVLAVLPLVIAVATAGSVQPQEAGSRAAPLAPGVTAELGGGWRLTIVSIDPDATAQLLQQDLHNRLPRYTTQIVLVYAVVENGAERDRTIPSRQVHWVSGLGVDGGASCDLFEGLDNDLARAATVPAGASMAGVLCRAISRSAAQNLLLAVDPLGPDQLAPTYFTLLPLVATAAAPQPEVAVPAAPPVAEAALDGRLLQAPDGALYLVQGGRRARVLPVAVSSEQVANIPEGEPVVDRLLGAAPYSLLGWTGGRGEYSRS